MSITKKALAGVALASLSLAFSVSSAAAHSASAQTRAERAAERRAMAEQRLEALSSNRAERLERQTIILTRMSEVTPEMIQERLDIVEMAMLDTLAEADAELIASKANVAGTVAGEVLTTKDIEKLTDEQVDKLVAAAGRAATVTPEDVEALLDTTTMKVTDAFDTVDAEEIASTLNEVGEKALGVEALR